MVYGPSTRARTGSPADEILGEAFGGIEDMGVKLLVLEESLIERGIPRKKSSPAR
jgi:hypothetical protein